LQGEAKEFWLKSARGRARAKVIFSIDILLLMDVKEHGAEEASTQIF
jgi:hypothetical protein